MESHYSGHLGIREASLNCHMQHVEVIMHPDLARDWEEHNMNKKRRVLDAAYSHLKQCQTIDHLISVWTKASKMYNNPNVTLDSQVFSSWGTPFDKVRDPISQEHHMQSESFQKN